MTTVAPGLHTIRVRCPEARTIFTEVAIDDVPLRGVTRIAFDSGQAGEPDGLVKWTIELYAGVEVDGVLQVDD